LSTGGGSLSPGLYARTNAPGGVVVNEPLPATIDPLAAHTYPGLTTGTHTVLGGSERVVKLRLANATKRKLAAIGKLNLKAVVTAGDHLGNVKKTRYVLKVRS
jgi:hypothetical protein